MNMKKLFGCRWEKIARRRSWADDISDVPKWVEKRYWGQWKKRSLYGTSVHFKGNSFVYKVVTSWPKAQGQTPRVYYRRLRRKAII